MIDFGDKRDLFLGKKETTRFISEKQANKMSKMRGTGEQWLSLGKEDRKYPSSLEINRVYPQNLSLLISDVLYSQKWSSSFRTSFPCSLK